MNVFNRFNTELSKAFDNYVNTYLGPEGVAFTSPNKTAYDIAVNEAAARVPSETLEGTFPGILGQTLGTASDIVMPALALGSSPFYDLTQAASRARAKYGEPDVRSVVGDDEIPMGPSLPQYAKAVADENIIRSAIGRTAGAGKNLANRISRISDGLGNFFFTPLGADSDIVPTKPEDDLMKYGDFSELMESDTTTKEGILKTLLSKAKDVGGNVFDKISNLGIVGVLKNLDNFKNLSPLDQQFILEQAGGDRPMKDAFGYNIRSARGNYANLVSRRAQIARNRALFKQPLRPIDLYYQKKEAERAKADRAILDAEFAEGRGGSGQDFTGGRYDGADSFETYSKEPTAYSGSS